MELLDLGLRWKPNLSSGPKPLGEHAPQEDVVRGLAAMIAEGTAGFSLSEDLLPRQLALGRRPAPLQGPREELNF
jgi:hypothetical protein